MKEGKGRGEEGGGSPRIYCGAGNHRLNTDRMKGKGGGGREGGVKHCKAVSPVTGARLGGCEDGETSWMYKKHSGHGFIIIGGRKYQKAWLKYDHSPVFVAETEN